MTPDGTRFRLRALWRLRPSSVPYGDCAPHQCPVEIAPIIRRGLSPRDSSLARESEGVRAARHGAGEG
jgi:hypothetical protein